MQKINVIQALNLSGDNSLFDKFLANLQTIPRTPFSLVQVIVPSTAIALWLKEQISQRMGICANFDFVVLPGPVIENIYSANFPSAEIFNFDAATFILHDIILNQPLDSNDLNFSSIKKYITNANGEVDIYKSYQLAAQLKAIFFEYLFMRTDELNSAVIWQNEPKIAWQQFFWEQLVEHVHNVENKILFTDVYDYFLNNIPTILPQQVILFAQPSIFPAQLKILTALSKHLPITWYHLAISNYYYGDLLDYSSRNKLERKVLGYPNLTLDDLYLMDGNPLVANLANQSRELTELLLNNIADLDETDLTLPNNDVSNHSLLQLVKSDIRSLTNRIDPDLRLLDNHDYYAEPLAIAPTDRSIEVNICHTRMREVQVAFNSIAAEIQHNNYALNEILITAPDIDDYAAYLQAVFNEEYLLAADGSKVKIPYNLTGNRNNRFAAIIETIQQIFNVPYKLPVNYLVDVISDSNIMNNLAIDENDVERCKKWLFDNNTHLGYDVKDYHELRIAEQDLYSLKRFIHNLTLGACIPHAVYSADKLAQYDGNYPVVPYDNLDFSETKLLAKLGLIVDLLIKVRREFYIDETTYQVFSIERFKIILDDVRQLIFQQPEDQLNIERFTATILGQQQQLINLPIVNRLIDDYLSANKGKLRFTGALTCASLANVRDVPFKLIYIMGLNFGEYPRIFAPDQMSYLASNWHVGDRNYTLEDKQIFLDTILATQEKLMLSYLGRDDTDNSDKEPSSALSLLLETVKNSVMNGEDCLKQITKLHSLHPFYNNREELYSGLWSKVIGLTRADFTDKRWNALHQLKLESIAPEKANKLLNPSVKQLITTLSYSNTNLNKVLDIYSFTQRQELLDYEPFELVSGSIAQQLYQVFIKLENSELEQLYRAEKLLSHVRNLGILNNQVLGQEQLTIYYKLYQLYSQFHGQDSYKLQLKLKHLDLNDSVLLKNNVLYLMEPFHRISFAEKDYGLSLNLKAQYLVWQLIFSHSATIYTNSNNNQCELQPEVRLLKFVPLNEPEHKYGFVVKELTLELEDKANLLNEIELFYLESLTARTLIDNKSIKVAIEQLKANASTTQILYAIYNELGKEFGGKLEKYKQDPLWGSDLDNLEDDKECLLAVVAAARIFAKVKEA